MKSPTPLFRRPLAFLRDRRGMTIPEALIGGIVLSMSIAFAISGLRENFRAGRDIAFANQFGQVEDDFKVFMIRQMRGYLDRVAVGPGNGRLLNPPPRGSYCNLSLTRWRGSGGFWSNPLVSQAGWKLELVENVDALPPLPDDNFYVQKERAARQRCATQQTLSRIATTSRPVEMPALDRFQNEADERARRWAGLSEVPFTRFALGSSLGRFCYLIPGTTSVSRSHPHPRPRPSWVTSGAWTPSISASS